MGQGEGGGGVVWGGGEGTVWVSDIHVPHQLLPRASR